MRTSIATVCLSGTLPEKLTAVASAGFDGVEIFENDLLGSPLRPEEVRARAADLGLSIDLYQPFRDFETDTEEALERNLWRAERKFAVMERLGADLLLVCSGTAESTPRDDARIAEQLHRLAQRAEAHGVRIAYEALAWGRHVSTYDHAWRLVETADHPALGTCLDSFHILSRGCDPRGIEDIPGEKVFFLQLADAPKPAMDVLSWSRHHRCFPGQGAFDVEGLVRSAVAAGYAGPLSLEVFNDVFREADAGRTAVDAMRSLLSLQEQAGLATPPPAVVPTDCAFAEIAAPDTEPVRALLRTLGFTRTGRHGGGKPVELWQQGDARILLNTAGSSRREGAAVAALGLESPDPAASVRRAEALCAPPLPRRRAADDAEVESVAAPDGTELFFCRTGPPELADWLLDFAPAPVTATAPGDSGADGVDSVDSTGGISRIDHVALPQPWHHFDEASLFYRRVLGLGLDESLDLADPYGLFRSRAVTHPGSRVRIALNVAYGPGEQDPRPQHIALATDDIVAAARRITAAGAALLPIPDNYYDDLEARHGRGGGPDRLGGLDPETLGTLRELGILYDRDAEGEFWHCYTVTIGRVFFEIVQRGGDYRGYGAPNAPVRLAAQHTAALRGGGVPGHGPGAAGG